MIGHIQAFRAAGVLVPAAPAAAFSWLGLSLLAGRKPSESETGGLSVAALCGSLLALAAAAALSAGTDGRVGPLLFDGLSVSFAGAALALSALVCAFSRRYMHAEEGFHRFFLVYASFALGICLAALAGRPEVLFAGWELVGLASVLLIAYFHERPAPARGALRVWSVYRLCDAALLAAVILMHRGRTPPMIIGFLLLAAAAGKSALVPFSGWLPRAMEGPTPSSAVFYGAVSIHLGPFLLLRYSDVLAASTPCAAAAVALGLATALYAKVAGSVQTDVKSSLAYASLAQVGLITAEIGLGLHGLALAHMAANACLRAFQLLRAPSVLHEEHELANAGGGHGHASEPFTFLPDAMRERLYAHAYARTLDAALWDAFIHPLARGLRAVSTLERGAALACVAAAAGGLLGRPEPAAAAALILAAAGCADRGAKTALGHLALAQAALAAAGLAVGGSSLPAALETAAAAAPALAGLGLSLRALDAGDEPLGLGRHHGLFNRHPWAAALFLLGALSLCGFPGTPGFFALERLAGEAFEASPVFGALVGLTCAATGVAGARAYFRLFTGARPMSLQGE